MLALTLTLVGEYDVPVERLWQAWTDPRQLERFWGPPEWPARFLRHDVVAGGRSLYVMTGPDGDRSAGYWQFEAKPDVFRDATGNGLDIRPSATFTKSKVDPRKAALQDFCHVLLNSNEFLYVE